MLKIVSHDKSWRVTLCLKFINVCAHGCFYCYRVLLLRSFNPQFLNLR